jgi:uncharacterized protein (DUF58 family)
VLIPSRPLVLLLALALVPSLLAAVEPRLVFAAVIWDGLVLGLALVDAWLARRPLVTVERRAPSVLSLGRANRIALTVRSRADRPLRVEIQQDLFEDAQAPELPLVSELKPREVAELAYHITPTARGQKTLGSHTLRYGSPLRLWQRQLRVADELGVRVYPDLLQIRAYELLVRRQNDLARAMRQRGGETEFERLREFTRDDEYRRIDWKATARHQKLIAKEHQLESNQHLMLVLDAGRLMTSEVAQVSRFDHALNASLMLAHVATRTGDRVGFAAFRDTPLAFIPPSGGRGAVSNIVRASYDLEPQMQDSNLEDALDFLERRVRQRCLMLIFTHLNDEVSAQALVRRVRGLGRRHLALVVTFRETEVDELLERGAHEDPYTLGAAAEFAHWRAGVLTTLRRSGALVLDAAPGKLTPQLLQTYLDVKARHLL